MLFFFSPIYWHLFEKHKYPTEKKDKLIYTQPWNPPPLMHLSGKIGTDTREPILKKKVRWKSQSCPHHRRVSAQQLFGTSSETAKRNYAILDGKETLHTSSPIGHRAKDSLNNNRKRICRQEVGYCNNLRGIKWETNHGIPYLNSVKLLNRFYFFPTIRVTSRWS